MRTDELPVAWRTRAEQLAPFAPAAAEAFRAAAGELEAAVHADERELLTMREAVAYCGYSGDWLTRLVRVGKLTNYGRKHAPRFKRAELPLRAQADRRPSSDGTLPLRRRSGQVLGATPRQAAASIARR